jgi:hypothetical protein
VHGSSNSKKQFIMTFTETIQPQTNLKIVLSLLLPVCMYQEHIWKDWLSGDDCVAYISKPFLAAEIYQNGKYSGLLTSKQLKEHLNLDVSNEKESLKNKALAYLKTRTSTDEYNQMMYKQHISHLEY